MKRNIKSLLGFKIGATDGEIGEVSDVYFDDHTWTIRYLIVNTGNWLSGRKVLISPEALLQTDWENRTFPVNLTTEQIKNSPDIDTEKPVSLQHEMELNQYYPWSNYWVGGFGGGGLGPGDLWGGGIGTTGMMMGTMTPLSEPPVQQENNAPVDDSDNDSHLRSYHSVKGYSISATDGGIGDVEDLIIDDSTWKVHFMVVDTGSFFPGKKVLLSPRWIKDIDWATSSVIVDVSTEKVKSCPEFDRVEDLDGDYESNLHNHYRSLA